MKLKLSPRKPGKLPVRIPTPKPTIWHKDKSKYNRKRKHKGDANE